MDQLVLQVLSVVRRQAAKVTPENHFVWAWSAKSLKLRPGLYLEYSVILKAPEELWRGAMVMRHPYALRGSSVPYLTRGSAY